MDFDESACVKEFPQGSREFSTLAQICDRRGRQAGVGHPASSLSIAPEGSLLHWLLGSLLSNPADNPADMSADSFEDLLVDKSCQLDSWLVAERSADSLRATPQEVVRMQLVVELSLFEQKLLAERWSKSKLWMRGKLWMKGSRFDWLVDWRCETEERCRLAAVDYSRVDKPQWGRWL